MFWDSSALIPLLLPEPTSASLLARLQADPGPVIWWASPVECQSAVHRRRRQGGLADEKLSEALERLAVLVRGLHAVAPSGPVRERAGRVLSSHPLRAADALQLAAALIWCEEAAQGESFVCLDLRLREAAAREGFSLLPA